MIKYPSILEEKMTENNYLENSNKGLIVERDVFIPTEKGKVCFEEITHKRVRDDVSDKEYLVSYGKLVDDNQSVCVIFEKGKEPIFFGQMHGYLHGQIFVKIENQKLFMGIYENSLDQYFDFKRKGESFVPLQAIIMLNLLTGESDGYVKENLRAITFWDMASQATQNKTARYLYRSTEKAFEELNEEILLSKKREIERRRGEKE